MSMFENSQYRWRETYFVLFDASKRPTLERLQHVLGVLNSRFMLTNLNADESGKIESLTLLSPDDFAALDICYLDGEEVLEQGAVLADEMKSPACQGEELVKVERIRRCTGRFDILHFEQVVDFHDEGPDEMLDPTALLVVLDALVELTGGIAVDPQAGTLL